MARPTKVQLEIDNKLFQQGLKRCRRCDETKSVKHYHSDPRKINGLRSYCMPCANTGNYTYIAGKQKKFQDWKKTLNCKRCGVSGKDALLHFHHRVPATKKFELRAARAVGKKKLQEELDKCDVLCAGCHNAVEPRGFVK